MLGRPLPEHAPEAFGSHRFTQVVIHGPPSGLFPACSRSRMDRGCRRRSFILAYVHARSVAAFEGARGVLLRPFRKRARIGMKRSRVGRTPMHGGGRPLGVPERSGMAGAGCLGQRGEQGQHLPGAPSVLKPASVPIVRNPWTHSTVQSSPSAAQASMTTKTKTR